MKRIAFLTVIIIVLAAMNANAGWLGISISSKAYWSEAEKSCLTREKGGCFHIEIGAPGEIPGQISNDNGLVLTVSAQSFNEINFREFFRNGQFYLEGEGTFEPSILKQLNLPKDFTLKAGTYKTTKEGDKYKIILR